MQEQAAPIRSPESAYGDDVFSVIEPDGKSRPENDPKLPTAQIVRLYKAMVRTRTIDRQLEKLQRQGRVGFHVGSLGEEACIIGAAAALRDHDWIFPCYREFGALLWRGFPLQRYVDNMYGNCDDTVQGRQMPDHYTGRQWRYVSVSSPVGTQINQAVGSAWAAKLKREDVVSAVFFGDGATSTSDFHTGLNFAGVFQIPTLFLLRNNRWAISVPSERQTAVESFADKAVAYGVDSVRCDGNDVLATYRVVREAVRRAAEGGGPKLIELLTYRLGGHSTSDDPRAYRVQDEVEQWRATDPLVRLHRHLETLGAWNDDKEREWNQEVEAELRACIERAEKKDKPRFESMFTDVYAEQPWHLGEQQRQVVHGPRAKKRD